MPTLKLGRNKIDLQYIGKYTGLTVDFVFLTQNSGAACHDLLDQFRPRIVIFVQNVLGQQSAFRWRIDNRSVFVERRPAPCRKLRTYGDVHRKREDDPESSNHSVLKMSCCSLAALTLSQRAPSPLAGSSRCCTDGH